MNSLVNLAYNLIPRVHTPDGLRQYQLTLLGFVVIYGMLHLSLFMDGIVSHVFFAPEIGTALFYAFLPATYSIRPAALLKRRFYILVGVATVWFLQPFQLTLDSTSPSLFDTRQNLTIHVTKTLNQIQIEQILSQGGKVEEGFKEQPVFAAQLAVALQALGWFSALISFLILVEAAFIWNKCTQIEKFELSSAEKEKNAAKAAAAASVATAAEKSNKTAK